MIRFAIALVGGRVLRDVRVQGRGGELGGSGSHLMGTEFEGAAKEQILRRLRLAIKAADTGRPLAIYEPAAGSAKVYFGPQTNERAEIVDIRGATAALHVEQSDQPAGAS